MHARQVGTGETAWNIARSGDMPLWVLAWFNQDKDLDRLSIGDELYLPVLGDTIATAAVTPEPEASEQDPDVDGELVSAEPIDTTEMVASGSE